jgi:hypothetical protein
MAQQQSIIFPCYKNRGSEIIDDKELDPAIRFYSSRHAFAITKPFALPSFAVG